MMQSYLGPIAVVVLGCSLTSVRAERISDEVAQEFKDCDECPTMVVIPAGGFTMGSPINEIGRFEEEGPQHDVTISRNLAVGKTEITRKQYELFLNESGRNDGDGCYSWNGNSVKLEATLSWKDPGYAQSDNHPVSCVSWDDAQAYVSWLSDNTGEPYRLLSEAEWEYAARAGSTGARHWGNSPNEGCSFANGLDLTAKEQEPTWISSSCTDGYFYAAPVGSRNPNQFGLEDMLGNVSEWTEDCWNGSYEGAPSDGSAWTAGNCDQRVMRGGSWFDAPDELRSASRSRRHYLFVRLNFLGFRVARSIE